MKGRAFLPYGVVCFVILFSFAIPVLAKKGGKKPKPPPVRDTVCVSFRDSTTEPDRIYSDGNGEYVEYCDGVDDVVAELHDSGDLILQLKDSERSIKFDFSNQEYSGDCDPLILDGWDVERDGFYMTVDRIKDVPVTGVPDENGWCSLDDNFCVKDGAGNVLWVLRYATFYPDQYEGKNPYKISAYQVRFQAGVLFHEEVNQPSGTAYIRVTHPSEDEWILSPEVIDADDEYGTRVANLASLFGLGPGKNGDRTCGQFVMPFEATVRRQN